MMDNSDCIITIIDYGVANLGSICNMLHKLGIETEVVSTPDSVAIANKIILPGVGSFDHGITALAEKGLIEPLRKRVIEDKVPILGICLGMQLLGYGSEEGEKPGLGLIAGSCIKFRFSEDTALKVPHMGWNEVDQKRDNSLLVGLSDSPRFYFTHSYHFVCEDDMDVAATTTHGIEFTSLLERNNVMGVQFHPEKSHRFGMAVLRNYGLL